MWWEMWKWLWCLKLARAEKSMSGYISEQWKRWRDTLEASGLSPPFMQKPVKRGYHFEQKTKGAETTIDHVFEEHSVATPALFLWLSFLASTLQEAPAASKAKALLKALVDRACGLRHPCLPVVLGQVGAKPAGTVLHACVDDNDAKTQRFPIVTGKIACGPLGSAARVADLPGHEVLQSLGQCHVSELLSTCMSKRPKLNWLMIQVCFFPGVVVGAGGLPILRPSQ